MALDYAAIKADNERRYGTDIGRIGPMLLADRYDDRTHFIFELLQNAEDALARREGWQGSRTVQFELDDAVLRISHFGKPFDEGDVRGVCGIAESTKQLTEIGRFGIGFKSVYAFTDRPEVHSGSEDFAIENFVWPVAVPAIDRSIDETVIVLPLKNNDPTNHASIVRGLQRLSARSLLFLRQIEQIDWSVKGGPSGFYLRSKPKILSTGVRSVTVIGQQSEVPEIEETWLIFAQQVANDDRVVVGRVELAFSLLETSASERPQIRPVTQSPLVVFFPTAFETHLGLLMQGPYRTTPSRDNVPREDPWNQHLVRQTAQLLIHTALPWLRDQNLLDMRALACLPLDRNKFGVGTMFSPLFEAVRNALNSKDFLPRYPEGYISAQSARLSRGQELRDLFAPNQLSSLFNQAGAAWLSGEITQDRTPELRRYLMQELAVAEITPDIVLKLDAPFLEAQTDAWILKLYHFLASQPALARRLADRPLIRLEDGTHIAPQRNGKPQAFLPSKIKTGFPTVRDAVCATDTSRKFLASLDLTEPDPVDDIVYNVLPTYRRDEIDVSVAHYEADILRILTAFATDSKAKRARLIDELRKTQFVQAVDPGNGRTQFTTPEEVYLATDRLKELFAGVSGVLLVDDTQACLRGEEMRQLLEACGAVRYLRLVEDFSLSWQERKRLREQAGHVESSGVNDRIVDWRLGELDKLLKLLPHLQSEQRVTRAHLLWEELAHLEERRGTGMWTGVYTWTHYGSYRATFDAAFVRKLNTCAWVPDSNGELQCPEFIVFDSLGWKPSPFLQTKIRFKPPIIETLAREAGIDPGVLDLLKQLGLTDTTSLRSKLGISEAPPPAPPPTPTDVAGAIKDLLGDTPPPQPPVPDPNGQERANSGGGGTSTGGQGSGIGASPGHSGNQSSGTGASSGHSGGNHGGHSDHSGRGTGTGKSTQSGSRPFVSYLAAHPDEEPPDPEGLDHAARMKLESQAIAFIIEREPQLQSTPTHNPGFDLFEPGADGQPVRWIEVKAMSGSFQDRPATMSHTQLDYARAHGEAYWLYVVEHAGTERAHLVRIQNPAGKAHTFTFDRGWLAVADLEPTHLNLKG